MEHVRNMPTSIKMSFGFPETIYINGIGYAWLNLENALVSYIIDDLLTEKISFIENKRRVIFTLNKIAKKTNNIFFADTNISGELGSTDDGEMVLHVSLLKIRCTKEELQKESPKEIVRLHYPKDNNRPCCNCITFNEYMSKRFPDEEIPTKEGG